MSFSDYLENFVLDVIFSKQAWVAPTIWLGLSRIDPGDDGSFLDEPPAAFGYTRLETSAVDWNNSSGGELTNASEFSFAVASGSWGVITHFVLFDELVSWAYLLCGLLTIPLQVNTATRPVFSPGDLKVKLT